jgi:hypothetical protein
MIYRLALGQPNQEDFIHVLSRGGAATRALLQPLVLDLSAIGLRAKRGHVTNMNGHEPISHLHSSITKADNILARPLPTTAMATDRESPAPPLQGVAIG